MFRLFCKRKQQQHWNRCNTEEEKIKKNNSFLFGILVSIIIHTIKKRHLIFKCSFYLNSSTKNKQFDEERRALFIIITIDINIALEQAQQASSSFQTYTRLTQMCNAIYILLQPYWQPPGNKIYIYLTVNCTIKKERKYNIHFIVLVLFHTYIHTHISNNKA